MPQVVVDAFDPSVLVSDARTEVLDFRTIKEEQLHVINMPLNQQIGEAWPQASPAPFLPLSPQAPHVAVAAS